MANGNNSKLNRHILIFFLFKSDWKTKFSFIQLKTGFTDKICVFCVKICVFLFKSCIFLRKFWGFPWILCFPPLKLVFFPVEACFFPVKICGFYRLNLSQFYIKNLVIDEIAPFPSLLWYREGSLFQNLVLDLMSILVFEEKLDTLGNPSNKMIFQWTMGTHLYPKYPFKPRNPLIFGWICEKLALKS